MRAGSPSPYVGPPPVPKMPTGLIDLVEGLTREVLKNNPKNVYEFCAKHMEKLLESRDGPSFKKSMLSLEQKIHEAQEKVRQRAKERRERYDREINARSLNTEQATTEFQEINENITSKSESDVSMINAMPPVHHEQGLKPDSEVEIAHKASYIADEKKSYKIENVQTKKEDVEILGGTPKLPNNTDLTHEKDISKEASVNSETTPPLHADDDKAIKNIHPNETNVHILSATDNLGTISTKLQAQNIASNKNKDSATTLLKEKITDETKAPTNPQTQKEENMVKGDDSNKNDKKNSSFSTEAGADSNIKDDSKSTIPLNEIVSLKDSAEPQSESDLLTATEDDSKSHKDEALLKKSVTDDIKQTINSEHFKKEESIEQKTDLLTATEDDTKYNKEKAPLTNNKTDDHNQAKNSENSNKKENMEHESDLLTATEDDSKEKKDVAPLMNNKLDEIYQTKNGESNEIDENNKHVIETILHVTKEVDLLSEKRDEPLNANITEHELSTDNLTVSNEAVSVIENNSNVPLNTNSIVTNGIDINAINTRANNGPNITPNGNDAVVVQEFPKMGTHKSMTILDEIVDDKEAFDKTAKVEKEIPKPIEKNETETTLAQPETSNLNTNVTEHTKENIQEVFSKESVETSKQEKEHTNNDNPFIQVSENSEIDNNKTILVESDLSKIDEDTTGENQNDHNNMDLETAAVTIQKVFRSFLFKSRNSTFDDGTNDQGTSLDDDSDNIKKEEYYAAANLNKERRPLGISRMDTVLQTVNEEKSLSLSTDDSSTLSSAATTIQAHVRGFLVRNRLNSNKTVSTNSVNSNELLESDTEQQKNKTVLNIHIVPEEGNYLSRDESIITSMELSLDGSPPSSVNLHPLSYDVSERRKLLKREDAVQSISPPSNNSGKLSEESVKELFINDETVEGNVEFETDKRSEEVVEPNNDSGVDSEAVSISSTATATTIINVTDFTKLPEHKRSKSLHIMDHDESDVITPYVPSPRSESSDYENSSKLVHSSEFHDALLPTRVTRNDTTVVREFKNVLVYFIIWNH